MQECKPRPGTGHKTNANATTLSLEFRLSPAKHLPSQPSYCSKSDAWKSSGLDRFFDQGSKLAHGVFFVKSWCPTLELEWIGLARSLASRPSHCPPARAKRVASEP
jgi:hypothetical protein